ncbi:redoxin domain-containing protein [Clostridium sp. MSJ-11]|uniref:Redoxin domain-containing protein n=1 Tax=Clostridium mobile TaxID=2841512 RepID=A0ABS6ENJ5_9CLOT|nr:redoxin domain-containing protein [Clostridium mobile]MBU5486337.1 redoxin domain-containing protein [Clostridium mobile]
MKRKQLIISILILLIVVSVVVVNYNSKKNLQTNDIKVEDKVAEKDKQEDKQEGKEPKKIEAIDFKLQDLEGKEISLSEFKGKKVFLNFWASWCGPCKAEMPHMQTLYEETKDKDIVILAVNVGESKDKVKSFIEKNKYTFPILLDMNQEVATQYGIAAFPTSFFIDEEGYVYNGIQGQMDLDMMREQLMIKK